MGAGGEESETIAAEGIGGMSAKKGPEVTLDDHVLIALSTRPWTLRVVVNSADQPTGSFAMIDAKGRCVGITQREDDGRFIVEAVNAYSERPVLINEPAKGRA